MNPLVLLSVALGALRRNLLRSMLTVLGVVIGIAAVIAMISVGDGARTAVAKQFESMGTNLLLVTSGSSRGGGVMGGGGSRPTLSWADIEALRTRADTVRWVAPQFTSRQQLGSESANWNAPVYGTTADFWNIRAWDVTSGRLLTDDDNATGAKVAVIGTTTASKLFGEADPVGQQLRIKSVPYEIIGLLGSKGQSAMGQDNDDAVYVPAKTFTSKIDGQTGTTIRAQLLVSAISADQTAAAQAQVGEILRETHKLQAGAQDDFEVRNLAEFAKAQAASTEVITTMLAAIAAVSLLVGGIGIMNIMLVSVIERTREIGLRMAVGARPLDVLLQFVVEALVLALLGGLLGLAVGAIAARKLSSAFGFAYVFPASTATLAVGVACGIGLLFGIYPALRAARLDPITALRYEA
jgi:putative ABC transport system permease protein